MFQVNQEKYFLARAGILSGKPEQEVAASQRIAAYARQNPALIEAIPEVERTRALAVAGYANLGLPAARAVELAAQQGSASGSDTAADRAPLDLRGQLGGGTQPGQAGLQLASERGGKGGDIPAEYIGQGLLKKAIEADPFMVPRQTGPFKIGNPDDRVKNKIIVQPHGDKKRLLQGAREVQLNFDHTLGTITKNTPGVRYEGSRVKEDGPRLDQKIRDAGGKPELVRDYIGGRLVPSDDDNTDAAVAALKEKYEIIDIKDRMAEPLPQTGYTAIHVQVKLPNGMTAEVQVQPEPFNEAVKAQRELFEEMRKFEGEEVTGEIRTKIKALKKKSTTLFEKAWKEWLSKGNRDRRIR